MYSLTQLTDFIMHRQPKTCACGGEPVRSAFLDFIAVSCLTVLVKWNLEVCVLEADRGIISRSWDGLLTTQI